MSDTTFLEELLYELADYINSHVLFRDMIVYISRHEVIQGVQCPCVSFETSNEGKFTETSNCLEITRPLDVIIHTDTINNKKIIKELSRFEENMIKHIDIGFKSGMLWDSYSAYLKPRGVKVMSHWTRNAIHGQNDETQFHSNIKIISYDLVYKLG